MKEMKFFLVGDYFKQPLYRIRLRLPPFLGGLLSVCFKLYDVTSWILYGILLVHTLICVSYHTLLYGAGCPHMVSLSSAYKSDHVTVILLLVS